MTELKSFGTATISFKNFRYFQDIPQPGYNIFSYYAKLAHKRLHSYTPLEIENLVMDIEFL